MTTSSSATTSTPNTTSTISSTIASTQACDFSVQYRDGPLCRTLTLCTPQQFISLPSTLTSDRQCQVIRTCGASEFEVTAPTPSSNRVCQAYTICNATQVVDSAPTSSSDRTCSCFLPSNANLQSEVTILSIDSAIEQLTGDALAQEIRIFEEAVVDFFKVLNGTTPVTSCNVLVTAVDPYTGSNRRRAVNQLYRNMVITFSFSVPTVYLEDVGCLASDKDSTPLFIDRLRNRSRYYRTAYIVAPSSDTASAPVYLDGSCACNCAKESSKSSSTTILIWILPLVVFILLVLLLIYRRSTRKQEPSPDAYFEPIADYTQPPAVLPDFVPPPSYDRSMPPSAVHSVDDYQTDRDAPQYKPPPKYPGRRASNENVHMLPDYVEPPTYKDALVLRVKQGRGRIPDFSESDSDSDSYPTPPTSITRPAVPSIPHHRRAPPSFHGPPEFDLAQQRPASSRSSRSSRSSPPFDSISMNSGLDSISMRSVPEYEDPPLVYFDDDPVETARDRGLPRPPPVYEPPPTLFDDDASSESSFGS